MDRKGAVTFKGNPLTLTGNGQKTGNKAPDFTVIGKDLKPVTLKDFSGKTKLISVTPSLDTPVCDTQARRFNTEAARLPAEVAVLNISMDLPFAIGRFCATAGIERIGTYSDHRDASFGANYGVLIKELRLLARAIFLIDADDVIRYMEVVPEMTDNVNFAKALEETNKLFARK